MAATTMPIDHDETVNTVTRIGRARYRICLYHVYTDHPLGTPPSTWPTAWSGFVEQESPRGLLGFLGRHPTRRSAMIGAAKLIAEDIR